MAATHPSAHRQGYFSFISETLPPLRASENVLLDAEELPPDPRPPRLELPFQLFELAHHGLSLRRVAALAEAGLKTQSRRFVLLK
jgi:hypothetical protein